MMKSITNQVCNCTIHTYKVPVLTNKNIDIILSSLKKNFQSLYVKNENYKEQ